MALHFTLARANPVTNTLIKGAALTATVCLFLSLSACAKKGPAPDAAGNTVSRASAGTDPTTPAGVTALAKELPAHPRSVYSSRSGKYEYFIGGELLAAYDAESRILVITGHGPAEGTVCKYSFAGALFVEPQNPAGNTADASGCNGLVTQLHRHMRR